MKRILAFAISTLLFCALTVSALAVPIGTVVNHTLYTDIVALIDDHPIRSYNVDNRMVVVAEDLRGYGFYADAYPALKSEFERQAEILDTHYIQTKQEPGTPYAQTSFLRRAAGSTPTAPSSGEVIFFDRALLESVRDLLDGASCTPYINYTPPEIEAIILEEISAYLGGGADADSCVKHIQSCVSIWLAEHQ